jgi:hypothetical protein
MKTKKYLQIAVMAIGASVMITACGGTRTVVEAPVKKYIKIPDEQKNADNYADKDLKKFVRDNPGCAVVVRDKYSSSGGNVSGTAVSSRLSELLDQGLLRNGFNVKDRLLFEKVADKMGDNFDLTLLQTQTQTDLIFEVTEVKYNDAYPVDICYTVEGAKLPLQEWKQTGLDKKGRPVMAWVPYSTTFYGKHIEIKVIMLTLNKVGGIFRYYITPCSDATGGCEFVDIRDKVLYYRLPNSIEEEKNESARSVSSKEKQEKEMGDFISKVVITKMIEEIKQK